MVETLYFRSNKHGKSAHRTLESSAAKNRSNCAHKLFQSRPHILSIMPISCLQNHSYCSLNFVYHVLSSSNVCIVSWVVFGHTPLNHFFFLFVHTMLVKYELPLRERRYGRCEESLKNNAKKRKERQCSVIYTLSGCKYLNSHIHPRRNISGQMGRR